MFEIEHIKKAILDREFGFLNARQREAVYKSRGPVLVLAGAGSGKTTVLVNKIVYLVNYGDAYNSDAARSYTAEEEAFLAAYAAGETCAPEDHDRAAALLAYRPVNPWNILAITFTNKAANELKERIVRSLGERGEDVFASTFHSACTRMLRRDGERIGLERSFTIYDTDDQKRLMKDCIKSLGLNDKNFPPMSVLSVIGRAKDNLLTPEAFSLQVGEDYRLIQIAKLYAMYQKKLEQNGALDFDDIIFKTVTLLSECPEVLDYYQTKFKNIVVDEYQDTNHAQYVLVSLLADKWRNLCVVGDDDQSIYKFRGATIENILSFEKQYPDATVIRLEQNYRSTKTILDSANHAISHNTGRKGKTLWTENDAGEPIGTYCGEDEYQEGRFIANTIIDEMSKNGRKYSDFAVLYRANSQSSAIEQALSRSGLPYKIFGGMKFYDRAEVKDITAYLCLICNKRDDLRLKRIINTPKRAIGEATVALCEELAARDGVSLSEVVRRAAEYPQLSKASAKLAAFVELLEEIESEREGLGVAEFVRTVIEKSGLLQYISAQDKQDGRDRMANVETLLGNIENYEEQAENPSLEGFFEEVSLATELDNLSEDGTYVALLTMHGAKGLEFPVVFLAGMEEEVFPSGHAILDQVELEEERRLAYVGVTRAKEKLYLTRAKSRRTFKGTHYHKVSRFWEEIPEGNRCDLTPEPQKRPERPSAPARAASNLAGEKGRSAFLSRGTEKQAAPAGAQFSAGDRVRHASFGEGVVQKVSPVAGDQLLEVQFETVGVKKLMANYARLSKV